jgi:hypothetical protein
MGNRSCCMKRAGCSSQQLTGHSTNDGNQGVRGNGCCTPLVHQAVPTVVTSPVVVDGYQMMALTLASDDMPSFSPMEKTAVRLEFDTGRPPNDLVISLHRLVI